MNLELFIVLLVIMAGLISILIKEIKKNEKLLRDYGQCNLDRLRIERDFVQLREDLLKERDSNRELISSKKSTEVRTGQLVEVWVPLLEDFKYNKKDARFLGNPIDYVIFDKDEVVFLEVKSGGSRLSKKQRHIRDLIKEGKVVFKEMRLKNEK